MLWGGGGAFRIFTAFASHRTSLVYSLFSENWLQEILRKNASHCPFTLWAFGSYQVTFSSESCALVLVKVTLSVLPPVSYGCSDSQWYSNWTNQKTWPTAMWQLQGGRKLCIYQRHATGPSFHLKISYGYITLPDQQHRDKRHQKPVHSGSLLYPSHCSKWPWWFHFA